MNKMKINELRAKGTKKDYVVTFQSGLNIVAGEMSTGKTTILELIDFCLGAKDYPKYPEIVRNVIGVLLEIEIGGEQFTIQRQLFSNNSKSIIHFSSIANLQSTTRSIEVLSNQTLGEESISSFIMSKIGLSNIKLKEAPTKDSTGTDVMSLRDILWFCYVERRSRVAAAKLLFENEAMKKIKLRQVADVIFDLHSTVLAALGSELDITQEAINEGEKEEKILLKFVESQGILSTDNLTKEKTEILNDIEDRKSSLAQINSKMSGSSDIAKGLQDELLKLRTELQEVRTDKRSQEKTLQRLIPLRAQYYEDISKYKLIEEAKVIIDPLSLVICPVCLSSVSFTQDKEKPSCSLCGNTIVKDPSTPPNISREIRSTERKLRELATYVDELEQKIKNDNLRESKIEEGMKIKSSQLDNTLNAFVSPYVTEIEGLVSGIGAHENEIKHLEDAMKIRNNIGSLREEIIRLKAKEYGIIKRIEEERKKSTSRIDVVNSLSNTYYNQLRAVHFPKVNQPQDGYFDADYAPYVHRNRYDEISSEGGTNLSCLCWLTTIFEEATIRNANHPGFLMYDSVQAGIGMGRVTEEFRDKTIVEGIYQLLNRMSTLEGNSQIIIVDNHPPESAIDYIRVRYTGDRNNGVYGFIDNEVE